ncbi:hypothetical protein HYS48_03960 [Candidatus Woesearchaeota archaeon]|nr:hypothetical protein [Candidatus Woesearchaeota archaeon]
MGLLYTMKRLLQDNKVSDQDIGLAGKLYELALVDKNTIESVTVWLYPEGRDDEIVARVQLKRGFEDLEACRQYLTGHALPTGQLKEAYYGYSLLQDSFRVELREPGKPQ